MMIKKPMTRIFLADLAYFNPYSTFMLTIPLNVGYIASYAQKLFANEIEVSLFKDPRELLEAARTAPPDILGLSCYYWNWHLDVLLAGTIKKLNPDCVTVIGGPQVDMDLDEQLDLYKSFKGALDFMVVNEGELGFAELLKRILGKNKKELFQEPVDGCTFFVEDDKVVLGKNIGLSLDLETLPSPFTQGLLDKFLTEKYMPMIQGSRMCPYSCAYCCSGKLKGKIRIFPDEIVEADIEYISRKYRDYPHRILYITDENFGINKRDSNIAEYLVHASEKFGYPQQTYCYFDKRLTDTIKKSALAFGDMNSGGLQLAFQSFNTDALKAVKRRNMTDEQIVEAVGWAHSNGLKTSSELIFGLPYETKETFLEALEFIMKLKIDTIAAHNLFLLKGIELNRKSEREKFGLSTKFRPSFGSAYDCIEDEFVCETEEVVISSNHFSFKDFMDIRKISLVFYVINMLEYYKQVFNFLIDRGHKVIPIFDSIMNPSWENQGMDGYRNFVNDFVSDANSELFDTHQDALLHLQEKYNENNNQVAAPARLNVFYAARLIYIEKWFEDLIEQQLAKLDLSPDDVRILEDLVEISEKEWVDIKHPEVSREIHISGHTLDYLKIPKPEPDDLSYVYKMNLSEQQQKIIESYNQQYLSEDDSYYYNILDYIHPRKHLRYECIEVQAL